jgi:hypothetical protein
MNIHIWIRNPYTFRIEEQMAITETLRRIHGGNPSYHRDWPVDYVSVHNVTITTARKMAQTITVFHLQAAIRDRNFGYYRSSDNPALQVEVEIRGVVDGRPDWAKKSGSDATPAL